MKYIKSVMKLVKIELNKWVSDEGKVFHKKGTNEFCTEIYPSPLNPIENYEEITEEEKEQLEKEMSDCPDSTDLKETDE
jgi:hypothetical protein